MPNSAKRNPAPRVKRFAATLERMRSRLGWVIARLPFDAKKAFGVRGRIKIKGAVNGFAFRTSLFAVREGGYILLVNNRMQKGAGTGVGSLARFEIELDAEKRVPAIPKPFQKILAQDRALHRWYEQLNNSTRVEIGKWVSEPVSAEAQTRRAEQIAVRLMETMEAERELPPLIATALARNPKARAGWGLMSSSRRRSHLLGIFYYRTPDGRVRRMEKMLEDATTIAEKRRA